ncbi:hypothetical protein A3K34_00495 [candidate division WWE3 bacterium RIFOXYC1_FULL_40_10]|uniref:HTH merR-type domain-containing protein n=1 Tax=candidate division WWE3 bacterium RIFOXYA2_FULL_46_9 TaxID=1802636 RepID=A0A1F4VYW5_UNCKA|nr:MAG: hypothetical protein A3K58_00495 [candidate division WWE3 bacterium RIFOXYB1_FULL_40_22]OGC61363.1 MAG: hypothetical protein A3K37_00495 [candidate division WWE3 bacterium RIFOXYA1_FULL_40_11]OGC62352.1 MAG: hypothetical protein A2264_05285 [candidate division WWE3 bacterium RIFOXYA2_FULL_46_9]OGC65353.1 MAG: hypothetical protein A2326_04780 [candidate division WWE3 bacterium RIFOXYB2_FULL_41_6]OGC65746.1 MAG: hypothetical protein A3K34_00495 [candidate division WWE3 bacterium RIFOXYC1_
MEKLIEVDKLIEEAEKAGIDLGKGTAYNRLRYFTKMGWLPNMKRVKNSTGHIKGHYPIEALELLKKIAKLKKQNIANDKIGTYIKSFHQTQGIKSIFHSSEFQKSAKVSLVALIIILVLLAESGLVKIGKSYSKSIPNPVQNFGVILQNGTSFVPKDRNEVYIELPNSSASSFVHVTFLDNYSPAARYWVEKPENKSGFVVKLDTKVYSDTSFNWWVTK